MVNWIERSTYSPEKNRLNLWISDSMTKTEKRDCERYVFDLPIHAAWKDAAGETKKETGSTRDISSSGVFMICKNLIDKGCEIDLPALAENAKSRLSVRGKVVRNISLTNSDTGYGHGIMFNNYKILKLNP
jgi:PilZ domain-containing protein